MDVAYACDCMCLCEFWGKNSFKGGRECKTQEKLNFSSKRKNSKLPL